MFEDLKKQFIIEDGYCIATEVLEHDKKKLESDRKYKLFKYQGEEIVKFEGKYYRHRRILDNFEIKPLGLTAQDIIRGCQGPIKILKKRRD